LTGKKSFGLMFISLEILILSLGVWQVCRYFQQVDRIRAFHEPAIPFSKTMSHTFKKVTVTGVFDHAKAMFFHPRTYKGQHGGTLYTPLKVKDRWLLVQRGWMTQQDYKTKTYTKPKGLQTYEGFISKPRPPTWLHVNNHPQKNQWHTLDLEQVENFLKTPFWAYIFVPLPSSSQDPPYEMPFHLKAHIPHKTYAATWFILAFSLGILYGFYLKRKKG